MNADDHDSPTLPIAQPSEYTGRGREQYFAPGGEKSPTMMNWQPPSPEHLAEMLPQYQIESLIGHGGMGAVYKGVQAVLERPVAIKLLPAEFATDKAFIARFHREARTLARLQHPNIVTVYEFGQTPEENLYFVMEFVDGTDLSCIIRSAALNPQQALELTVQVCNALHYAHGRGVIHRDIKPANVLVATDGHAKLADFGLARPETEDSSMLTRSNIVMGTPAYMAPEQREGHADQRADIYALGVMLYEMLTGKCPQGVFDPPSVKAQVDVRLDQVVIKAMQQEPERRYQQVSEMRTDVEHIRSTPPPKPAPRAAKPRPHSPNVRPPAVIKPPEPVQPRRPSPWQRARNRISAFVSIPARFAWKNIVALIAALLALLRRFGGMLRRWLWERPQAFTAASVMKLRVLGSYVQQRLRKQGLSPRLVGVGAVTVALIIVIGVLMIGAKQEQAAPATTTDQAAAVLPPPPQRAFAPSKTQYRIFSGQEVERFAWKGSHVAVLTAKDEADDAVMRKIVDTFDKVHEYYRELTGFDYAKTAKLDGLTVVAQDDTNPGHIVFSDLCVSTTEWRALYDDVAGHERYDWRLFERFGPHFWHFDTQLVTQNSSYGPVFINGFGCFASLLASEAAGVELASSNGRSSAKIRQHTEQLLDLYLADASLTFASSLAVNKAPVNPEGLDAAELFAAFCLRLCKDNGGSAYAGKLWTEVARRPEAKTAQDGIDNFILAACAAADKNLSQIFSDDWRWPISAAALAAADKRWGRLAIKNPEEALKNKLRRAGWRQFAVTLLADGTYKVGGIADKNMANLLPLKGEPVSVLDITRIPVTDLSPLHGLPLHKLNLAETPVSNLAPLKNLPLEMLCLSKTKVTDLAALQGLKLRTLLLDGIATEIDLTPLAGMTTLEDIVLPEQVKNIGVLRKLPGLKFISHQWGGTMDIGSRNPAAKFWREHDALHPPELAATKDQPWENSLGMKFVPVPRTKVLFCIHHTRRTDYSKFAEAAGDVDTTWQTVIHQNVPVGAGEDHPVVSVNWADAKAFCAWLGKQEGRSYRLPTDHEWSCAVGLGDRENATDSPEAKDKKITGEYPWGKTWPPPPAAANLADNAFKKISVNDQSIEGYNDGYPTTSPVLQFAPNALGLHDMGGNVWQWCEDWYDKARTERVLRGGCWYSWIPGRLQSSYRGVFDPGPRKDTAGFRCVIELPDNANEIPPPAPVKKQANVKNDAATKGPPPVQSDERFPQTRQRL